MHSIRNLKIWKKCIKRFSKKKLKQGDSTCSTSSHFKKCAPVPKIESSCKKKSFEQLSLYSNDSLEEMRFPFRKYGSKKSYDKQFTTKSASSESIITNGMTSDFSEDSLQRRSLSKDSLCKQMKEHIRNFNDSTESLKTKGFSNKVLLSKCQIRDRSQTVGQSYQLEKLFNRRCKSFYVEDQLNNNKKALLNYEIQLSQCEALSIDSLENTLTGRLNYIKKKFISEDSLNEEKEVHFDKLNNAYRKKSISDGILHESWYFQYLLDNSDSIVLNKILLNEFRKKYNLENKLQKSNTARLSFISLNESSSIENYESEDENLSIDSLSIPLSDLHTSKRCVKKNSPFSLSSSSYKDVNSSKLNSSQKIKLHQSNHQKVEMNQSYLNATDDMKCYVTNQDLKILSSNNSNHYNSMCSKESGKEDSISVDSLCDSLN